MSHLITSKPFSFYQFHYSTNGNSRGFSVSFPFVQFSDDLTTSFDDLMIRHAWIVRNNRKKTTTVLRDNRTVITADAIDRNLNRSLCTTAWFTRSMNVLTKFTRFLWYDLVATPQIFNGIWELYLRNVLLWSHLRSCHTMAAELHNSKISHGHLRSPSYTTRLVLNIFTSNHGNVS